MKLIALPVLLGAVLLAGCGAPNRSDAPDRAASPSQIALPATKTFTTVQPEAPERSNRDIARDFLDLSFQLESGRELTRLTRFEQPVSVKVTGSPPATLVSDLDRLIVRLRTEAGLSIGRVTSGPANITIEAVPRSEIRRALPRAACFVVPNIDRLSDYRRARNSRATNWVALEQRNRIAIFVPSDAAPQEVRDCLHEELAQALGPLNDLYRLSDSVFNDDNVHTVLTGFDMLVLRAYYDPALQNGMTRDDVAARLPEILARLNPSGERIASRPASATPRSYTNAIQTALGPGARQGQRMSAARKALRVAEEQNWTDHRRAFAHFANGRLVQSRDPALAQRHFQNAEAYYRQTPGTALHRAYLATHLAAFAISERRPTEAIGLVGPHLRTAERHENAALLATLMLLWAEALDGLGRNAEAQTVRLDSIGWARYGFGGDWAARTQMRDVATASRMKPDNGF